MRKTRRNEIEALHGRNLGVLLAERLKSGLTMREAGAEFGLPVGSVYRLARECGLDTYWVMDGKQIVARVP
jgi:hypothetical protein